MKLMYAFDPSEKIIFNIIFILHKHIKYIESHQNMFGSVCAPSFHTQTKTSARRSAEAAGVFSAVRSCINSNMG